MLLDPLFWVGEPGSYYSNKGHDQLQYITRLNNIVSGGIPSIALRTVDTNGSIPGGDRLQLSWTGGVQGPCDWVAVYDGDAPPVDSDDYIRLSDARQWVVHSDACPVGATVFEPFTACVPTGLGQNRRHTTNKNPTGPIDHFTVFYAGYVDGFGRLIKTWRR